MESKRTPVAGRRLPYHADGSEVPSAAGQSGRQLLLPRTPLGPAMKSASQLGAAENLPPLPFQVQGASAAKAARPPEKAVLGARSISLVDAVGQASGLSVEVAAAPQGSAQTPAAARLHRQLEAIRLETSRARERSAAPASLCPSTPVSAAPAPQRLTANSPTIGVLVMVAKSLLKQERWEEAERMLADLLVGSKRSAAMASAQYWVLRAQANERLGLHLCVVDLFVLGKQSAAQPAEALSAAWRAYAARFAASNPGQPLPASSLGIGWDAPVGPEATATRMPLSPCAVPLARPAAYTPSGRAPGSACRKIAVPLTPSLSSVVSLHLGRDEGGSPCRQLFGTGQEAAAWASPPRVSGQVRLPPLSYRSPDSPAAGPASPAFSVDGSDDEPEPLRALPSPLPLAVAAAVPPDAAAVEDDLVSGLEAAVIGGDSAADDNERDGGGGDLDLDPLDEELLGRYGARESSAVGAPVAAESLPLAAPLPPPASSRPVAPVRGRAAAPAPAVAEGTEESASAAAGTVVVLDAIHATPSQSARLGAPSFVSPVRRSSRKTRPAALRAHEREVVKEMLDSDRFAYMPNRALDVKADESRRAAATVALVLGGDSSSAPPAPAAENAAARRAPAPLPASGGVVAGPVLKETPRRVARRAPSDEE